MKGLLIALILSLLGTVLSQDFSEPRLARIIDADVEMIQVYADDLAVVSFWLESEDCFEEEIYSHDYPVISKDNLLVYFFYAEPCTDRPYKYAHFDIELKLNEQEYTAIFNDYAVRFGLYDWLYQINSVFTELSVNNVNRERVSLTARGTFGSLCQNEITDTLWDILKNIIFVSVILSKEPNTTCLDALTPVEHTFEIPISELAEGDYIVKLGELESNFKKH